MLKEDQLNNMKGYTLGQKNPIKQSTDYITPFQKLEGKVLNYRNELRLLLSKLIINDQGYTDKVLKQLNEVNDHMEKYDKHFNISTKRYGEIKTNESK